uniref:Retrotransposon gag domain-containing protein n=1 Tax=Gossypium raimondii TaxID=29730 RepID=A0A0D2Q3U1_GOSRA|nr:hypothetical protein B456_002G106200 [Gossypium raimondii]
MVFKQIYKYKSEKEVWDMLQNAHEATSVVKRFKLQILTTKFENLRMQENETIGEFYAKLCDFSNQAFAFGGDYSNAKLAKKVLRSLLDRFSIKATTIEEVKDIDTMCIDEPIGSLQTF